MHDIQFTINGQSEQATVPATLTLLDFLRDHLALKGTKEGCGIGECGACTILFDGNPVTSCLMLAVEADGHNIETIEGETVGGELSVLQQAFIDKGAIQCGFCTPGMIMSARGLLSRTPHPSHEEIIEAIAGNLCRCTGYETIVAAIQLAASRLSPETTSSNGQEGRQS